MEINALLMDPKDNVVTVITDVPAGQTVTGNFAIDHARFMQNLKASVASQTDGNDRPVKKNSTEE